MLAQDRAFRLQSCLQCKIPKTPCKFLHINFPVMVWRFHTETLGEAEGTFSKKSFSCATTYPVDSSKNPKAFPTPQRNFADIFCVVSQVCWPFLKVLVMKSHWETRQELSQTEIIRSGISVILCHFPKCSAYMHCILYMHWWTCCESGLEQHTCTCESALEQHIISLPYHNTGAVLTVERITNFKPEGVSYLGFTKTHCSARLEVKFVTFHVYNDVGMAGAGLADL